MGGIYLPVLRTDVGRRPPLLLAYTIADVSRCGHFTAVMCPENDLRHVPLCSLGGAKGVAAVRQKLPLRYFEVQPDNRREGERANDELADDAYYRLLQRFLVVQAVQCPRNKGEADAVDDYIYTARLDPQAVASVQPPRRSAGLEHKSSGSGVGELKHHQRLSSLYQFRQRMFQLKARRLAEAEARIQKQLQDVTVSNECDRRRRMNFK